MTTQPTPPWHVPAVLAVTQVVHWGTLFYAFSLLAPAMAAEMGWTREMVVGAFSAGLLAEAGSALFVGQLLDRVGARRVMSLGSLTAAFLLWLAGQVQTPAQLYAVWICLGASMAATLYQSAFAAVTVAFGAAQARRGIAVVSFAGGLASTIFWPLTGALVAALGWRASCTILALLNLACLLPHLLLPGPPDRPAVFTQTSAATPMNSRAVKGPLVALALVYAAIGLGSATIAVHLVPMLQAKGLGASAALLASLVGIAQVAGRLADFAAGARLSLRAVTALALAGVALGFAAMALGSGAVWLGAALVLYGAANGVLTIMRGALPAQIFGARRYGRITGLLSAAHALARAAGPVAIAWSLERTGGYGTGMIGVALLYLCAILLLWTTMARLRAA